MLKLFLYSKLSSSSLSRHGDRTEFSESLDSHPYHLSLLAGLLGYKLMLVNLYCTANTSTSMSRSPYQNIAYEFVLVSPAVPRMSSSSYFSCYFVGCCFLDFFKTARSTSFFCSSHLVFFPYSFC